MMFVLPLFILATAPEIIQKTYVLRQETAYRSNMVKSEIHIYTSSAILSLLFLHFSNTL